MISKSNKENFDLNNQNFQFFSNNKQAKYNFQVDSSFSDDEINSESTLEKTTTMNSIKPSSKSNINQQNKIVCRKLNFCDEGDDKMEIDEDEYKLIKKQSSTSFSLSQSKFDEEYVIIKTLCEGEMGIVYLCMKFHDRRNYVVKVTKYFSSKNDYLNMNQFVNSMNDNIIIPYSSFILHYKDFWIENDEDEQDYKVNKKIRNLYIVSEYALYGNLIDYLERLKCYYFNFTNQFYWDIIFEMMCGLLFIHKIGYIHFDIKPKNFLVNEYGKILLSDFCLTQPENIQNYTSDENEGDSIYLSPEFFNNKNITHKSDIYSLGLSILEILSQIKLPKNGNVWQRIRNYGIPDEFLNKIPDEFYNLINNMTNINPNHRKDIEEIFNDNCNYPQLYQRFVLLNNGNYERGFNPINWKEFQKKNSFDFSKVDNIHQRYVKRSDSWKFEHSYSFKFKKSDSSINKYT